MNVQRAVFGVIIFGVLSSVCFGYSGGSGEPNDPYQIADVNDLLELAGTSEDYNKCFIMTADINMAGQVFTTAVIAPDACSLGGFDGIVFTGVFDGAGHRINNLTIDDGGAHNDYLGIFGYTENGQINNLSVENITIKVVEESHLIGGLAGFNDTTTVTNCYVSGEISAVTDSRVIGGMIGRNTDGEIANCNTAINVYPGEHTTEVGGLIGSDVNGVITNCYTTGAVSGEYMSNELGGLIGRCNDGTITDCYTTGNVSGYGQIGGLVGHNVDNIVTNCYATGTLSGESWAIGGLIGENAYAQINNCSAVGAIFGEHYSTSLGGLIGYNNGSAGGGTVMNCFATGTVTGGDFSESLGGLIGLNAYATTIKSYATGAVISGNDSSLIGGLIGENHYSDVIYCYTNASVASGDNSDSIGGLIGYHYNGLYTSSFWDSDVNPDVNGIGNSTDPNVIGKTTEEMKQQATFTGWDFVEVWNIGENQTYPFLRTYLPSDINKDGETNFYDLAILASHWLEGD